MEIFKNNHMQHKLYLAGPFFTPQQRHTAELVEQACAHANLDAFSPRLRCFCPPNATHAQRRMTFDMNVTAIEKCDLVLACIDDFDAGTMWEMGYAYALGKPIYAYSMVPGRGLNLMLAQSSAGFLNGMEQMTKFLGENGMVDFEAATKIHKGEII